MSRDLVLVRFASCPSAAAVEPACARANEALGLVSVASTTTTTTLMAT